MNTERSFKIISKRQTNKLIFITYHEINHGVKSVEFAIVHFEITGFYPLFFCVGGLDHKTLKSGHHTVFAKLFFFNSLFLITHTKNTRHKKSIKYALCVKLCKYPKVMTDMLN